MGFIGLPELLVLALIMVLLFGRKRLPQLGRSMRESAIGFKRGITGVTPRDIIEGSTHDDATAARQRDRDDAFDGTGAGHR